MPKHAHDPVLGFYVDLMRGHRVIKSYDFFAPAFNRAMPLMGCLDFLVSEGSFSSCTFSRNDKSNLRLAKGTRR